MGYLFFKLLREHIIFLSAFGYYVKLLYPDWGRDITAPHKTHSLSALIPSLKLATTQVALVVAQIRIIDILPDRSASVCQRRFRMLLKIDSHPVN